MSRRKQCFLGWVEQMAEREVVAELLNRKPNGVDRQG